MPEESRRERSQEVSGLARAGLATAQAAPVPAANRRLWRAWHGVVMDDATITRVTWPGRVCANAT